MPQPKCWHAGVHPSSTDRPAFLAPSLAGWSSTSTPGGGQEFWCVCTAGMHPSIPAPQLLACWHAGMLVDGQPAREGGKNAGLSVLLGCTPACQHPHCWHVGMLACWSMASQRGRGRKMLACLCCWHAPQHASTPSCWHAGMLGCKPAAQTDQHDNNRGAGRSSVAVAVDACVYPSTQHPAILGYNRGCWPCGHARSLLIANEKRASKSKIKFEHHAFVMHMMQAYCIFHIAISRK